MMNDPTDQTSFCTGSSLLSEQQNRMEAHLSKPGATRVCESALFPPRRDEAQQRTAGEFFPL